MMQYVNIEDTVYLWFGANNTSGSGDDGASAVYDVRYAGAAAGAAPVLSGSATLLTHANYPAGAYEVAIAATVANGFLANSMYGVFCTLLVDSQNPTGFVGAFRTGPPAGAVLYAGSFDNVQDQTTFDLNWWGGLVADGVKLGGATIVLREGSKFNQRTIVSSTRLSDARLTVVIDSAPSWTITTAASFAIKDRAFPANFAALGINASGHVSRVTLTDTATALTEDVASGNAAQVHNQEPVEGFIAKLGTRRDGVVSAFPTIRIAPGEVTQIWIDCSRLVGRNLNNVDDAASSNAEVAISSSGVYGKYVSIVLDATNAEADDTTTITCDAIPFSGQVLKVSLSVVVDDD